MMAVACLPNLQKPPESSDNDGNSKHRLYSHMRLLSKITQLSSDFRFQYFRYVKLELI